MINTESLAAIPHRTGYLSRRHPHLTPCAEWEVVFNEKNRVFCHPVEKVPAQQTGSHPCPYVSRSPTGHNYRVALISCCCWIYLICKLMATRNLTSAVFCLLVEYKEVLLQKLDLLVLWLESLLENVFLSLINSYLSLPRVATSL